jgi:hypothetical protein
VHIIMLATITILSIKLNLVKSRAFDHVQCQLLGFCILYNTGMSLLLPADTRSWHLKSNSQCAICQPQHHNLILIIKSLISPSSLMVLCLQHQGQIHMNLYPILHGRLSNQVKPSNHHQYDRAHQGHHLTLSVQCVHGEGMKRQEFQRW